MNFSGLPNTTLLGQVLRVPLKLIPSSMTLPILQGRLRGKRWITGSHTHGCWLGSYELSKREIFEQTIQPGQIVFDIGANVGFYTLLASVLVGPKGRVIAFEPLPRNLSYLRQHLKLNGVRNVTIMAVAASDYAGTAYFDDSAGPAVGHLQSNGTLRVNTVTLDNLIVEGSLPVPNYLKVDVEGAEIRVLRGAAMLLEKHHPVLFLATHSPELHSECCDMLVGLGYDLFPLGNSRIDQTDEFIARYPGPGNA